MRYFLSSINPAFNEKCTENPEVCFQLSMLSYEDAKRLLNFSKHLVAQEKIFTASTVVMLGVEEAIKSYELLFSSLNHERQKSLSQYFENHLKSRYSVKSVQQSIVIFEIILQLVNDLIDRYKNNALSDISELLSEVLTLIQKRLLEERNRLL